MSLLFYGVLFVIEPSVFGDNNINVFGDVQGEMVGMYCCLINHNV